MEQVILFKGKKYLMENIGGLNVSTTDLEEDIRGGDTHNSREIRRFVHLFVEEKLLNDVEGLRSHILGQSFN